MGFGSLGTGDRIRILLELKGARQYIANMYEAGKATRSLAVAQAEAAATSNKLRRAQFFHNQVMYTERRLLFYSTLGMIGMAGAVAKLGFSYLNTKQQAAAALTPIIGGTAQLQKTMNQLFGLAAISPFTFQQTTQAFRAMFVGLHEIGISADDVTRTLTNMINALSQGGFLTEQALRRISNAVQDLAFQGTLTQRMVTRLGQLGVPVRSALVNQLGLTAQQMQNVGKLGIPAATALEAINKELETAPGFKNAAMRQALGTMSGLFAAMHDFISQAAGGGSEGVFGGIFKIMRNTVLELNKINQTGRAVTFTNIAEILNKQLSPNLNIVIDLFTLLEYTLKGFIGTLYVLAKILQIVLYPFAKLLGIADANILAMKLLGIVLGITLGMWTAYKAAVILATVAEGASLLITRAQNAAFLFQAVTVIPKLVRALRAWAFAETVVSTSRYYTGMLNTISTFTNSGVLARLTRAFFTLFSAESLAAVGAGLLEVGLLPITAIVAAVALLAAGFVVLYFKWKPFHNLVDDTWKFFQQNWYWAKFFMGTFGPLGSIVQGFIVLRDTLRDLVDLFKHPVGGGGGGFLGKLAGIWHTAFRFSPAGAWTFVPGLQKFDPLKRRATGGYASGWTMVGERGAELLNLPGGSRVFSDRQQVAHALGSGGAVRVIVEPQAIYFDRQKIGEVIARVKTDREARQ